MTVKETTSGGADDRMVFKEKLGHEVEEENDGSQSSSSSSETDSSPRRRKREKKKVANLHSQVLRVREEDLHIGEDDIIMEGFCGKDSKFVNNNVNVVGSPLKSVAGLSRPSMLPFSPLSGKIATVNNLRLDQDVPGV